MRERRKEPREGSEIDPETVCIQTVGAPTSSALKVLSRSERKRAIQKILRVSEMVTAARSVVVVLLQVPVGYLK